MAHQITSTDSMFSVRQMPWHGLGAVLDEYPTSIDDALDKSGLGWAVRQEPVYIPVTVPDPEIGAHRVQAFDTLGMEVPTKTIYVPLKDAGDVEYRANIRSDNGAVLGVVTDDYKVVGNREAFEFMDALINSDLYFETAGSLQGGKRVWVLARIPDFVEIGGDPTATYLYVANSHDGSMACTSAATPVRIVCANTLGMALRRSEYGEAAARTFRFRHTGNLTAKFAEARKVMGMTLDYAAQFKQVGDKLATERMTRGQFEHKVLDKLPEFTVEDGMGKRAVTNRTNNREAVLEIFSGRGTDGDTRGSFPNTKWTAVNALGEFADYNRRYTVKTNQVQRSFEDTDLKQRGFDLVVAA